MNLFDPKNNLEFRDYVNVMLRRKWYFILPFTIVVAIGAYKITSNVPLYQSKCIIQIKASAIQLLPSSIKAALPKVSEPATAYAVKKQILSSEYLLQVIERLNLVEHPEVVEKAEEGKGSFPDKDIDEVKEIFALRKLRRDVKVVNRTPTVVAITAVSIDPEDAYDIVLTLTDIYIADSFRRSMSRVQGAISFNDEQISIFKERLEDAEKRLETFKRNQITTTLLEENISSSELSRIHKALVAVEITINEKKDYVTYLSTQLGEHGWLDKVPSTPVIKENLLSIDQRINEMGELMKRFSWKSPEVINVNRKINDHREGIRVELDSFVKVKNSTADAPLNGLMLEKLISHVDIDILERKRAAFNQLIDSFKYASSQRPAEEMILAKLMAEVRVNRRIYNTFVQQNEGVQIEEMISRNDASDRFKVLEPPRRPLDPINAGSNMLMLVTALTALGMGSGAVYSREFLDSSFRTVTEVEDYLGIEVLGVVPNLQETVLASPQKRPILLIVAIVVIVLLAALFAYLMLV